MKNFAKLSGEIEGNKNTPVIIDAILHWLRSSPKQDALAGVSLLLGYKPTKLLTPEKLKELALIYTGYPDYLFEESQAITGDLTETVSLITGNSDSDASFSLHDLLNNILPALKQAAPEIIQEKLFRLWRSLPSDERMLLNRFLTGKFRSPADEHTVVKALAEYYRIPVRQVYILLSSHHTEKDLLSADLFTPALNRENFTDEFPLFAPEIITDINELPSGDNSWLLCGFGSGLRVLLESNDDGVFLWAEDWRLMNSHFPEIVSAGYDLPPFTLLEGELTGFPEKESASILEKRINKRKPDTKTISEYRVRFLARDCLIYNTAGLMNLPLSERLTYAHNAALSSPGDLIGFAERKPLADIKDSATNPGSLFASFPYGVLLQNSGSIYGGGFLLRPGPRIIKAVLVYAQQGTGRFTGIYSEYSWGIRQGEETVVIARSNEGLTEDEILRIDQFVKEKRTEKFGPAAAVPPEIWADITYERKEVSKRHKAGVVLRGISKVALMNNEK
ncbi:MAG: hypothetical protein HRU80_02430 [Ignavibacteriales bacterium]|nr:MAG: hypothetical protein HRU80_02430 [Ignavibacteriales bacterium]